MHHIQKYFDLELYLLHIIANCLVTFKYTYGKMCYIEQKIYFKNIEMKYLCCKIFGFIFAACFKC